MISYPKALPLLERFNSSKWVAGDPIIKASPEELMSPVPERNWDLVGRRGIKTLIAPMKIHQQVEGIERVKEEMKGKRPIFVFSNHLSWADHFLIMKLLNDHLEARVSALCKEKYYQYPFFRWVLRKTNQIPITNVRICFARWFSQTHGRAPLTSEFIEFMTNMVANPYHEANILKRQSLVRTAIYTQEMVGRKRLILGYPEGTRSERGTLQPIKTGIMQLPFEFKGTVVPAAISGTDKILPKGEKWYRIFRFYLTNGVTTNVKFGAGIAYSELLKQCEEKFERNGDIVNLQNARLLWELLEEDKFRAYTVEAERFERIFDESSLMVMRKVNEMLPDEYKNNQLEIKYPR